jgi:predicted DNA binding CopG/RHH family protein
MMPKPSKISKKPVSSDVDETQLLASFDAGQWQPVKPQASENLRYKHMASNALAKNRRVNIRISAMDLEGMQARAAQEGLPYQTLIASVLHKYASGRLVESRS